MRMNPAAWVIPARLTVTRVVEDAGGVMIEATDGRRPLVLRADDRPDWLRPGARVTIRVTLLRHEGDDDDPGAGDGA